MISNNNILTSKWNPVVILCIIIGVLLATHQLFIIPTKSIAIRIYTNTMGLDYNYVIDEFSNLKSVQLVNISHRSRRLTSEKNDTKVDRLDNIFDSEFFKTVEDENGSLTIKTIEDYYVRSGPTKMLMILERTSREPEGTVNPTGCFFEATKIGKEIYKRTASTESAQSICAGLCAGGCLKGAMEAMFEITDLAKATELLRNELVCENSTKRSTTTQIDNDSLNCFEIVGQALYSVYRSPSSDPKVLVSACKQIASPSMQYSCVSGVYKEWLLQIVDSVSQRSISPCKAVLDFVSACYRHRWEAMTMWIAVRDAQIKCFNVAESSSRQGCFHGMAYAYSTKLYEDMGELFPISLMCGEGDQWDQAMCVYGYWWGLPASVSSNKTLRGEVCRTVDKISVQKACLTVSKKAILESQASGLFFARGRKSSSSALTATPTTTTTTMKYLPVHNSTDHAVLMQYSEALKRFGNYVPLELIDSYYRRVGPSPLLYALETSAPYCHNQGHNLGKVVYLHMGSLEAGLQVCGRACTDGCAHGLLMQMFSNMTQNISSSTSVRQLLRPYYDKICAEGKLWVNIFGSEDCYHGMGHVIMPIAVGYVLQDGIDECKSLSTEYAQYTCATGAYMEYLFEYDGYRPNGLLPCNTTDDFPAACYRYMWQRLVHLHSPRDGIKICLSIGDRVHRQACFHGIGYAYAIRLYAVFKKLAPVGILCGDGDELDQTMCIYGAMWWDGPFNKNITLLDEVCRSVKNAKLNHICVSRGSTGLTENLQLFYFTSELRKQGQN